jgi:hypothetical protein
LSGNFYNFQNTNRFMKFIYNKLYYILITHSKMALFCKQCNLRSLPPPPPPNLSFSLLIDFLSCSSFPCVYFLLSFSRSSFTCSSLLYSSFPRLLTPTGNQKTKRMFALVYDVVSLCFLVMAVNVISREEGLNFSGTTGSMSQPKSKRQWRIYTRVFDFCYRIRTQLLFA